MLPMTIAENQPEKRRLGDFEINRELGRGGMGVVYEARQVSLNRPVALKVLSGGLGLTAKAVQRFRRESEAAAKLHHTNIVPVYATGEQDGIHFYAMELVDGPSLDCVIKQMRLATGGNQPDEDSGIQAADTPRSEALAATGPYVEDSTDSGSKPVSSSSSLGSGTGYFDAVARMIADVADALEYAHQQGVVHRDIKPSNLLLSPNGRLSVNDFGLARMLEQPGMTITGEFVGTAAYMSPEQITAGRVPLDHRTDIYSLGVTLYELLTLRRPFHAEQRDRVLAQILQKEPKAPRNINPKVPIDLETICLKAIDKDPDRRYQTAGQMAEDLRRYVNRFAILARRVGPIERLWKWAKRRPELAAAATGALLCALVAAGLAYRVYLGEQLRGTEREQHEIELLEEKRRSALDKAILAARQEDFEGAGQAIREAEQLGCSTGQVEMLLGQVALYQGKNTEALDHLRQAVELLPESVAAWSMLALAYYTAGRITEFEQALTKATQLPAITPEDFLFRGHAECFLDSRRGLQTLDEAVRRRPSVLARLVRIDVLKRNTLDAPDPERARQAMKEMQWIKWQQPDNIMVSSVSASVHLMCYHVFDEFGPPEDRKKALEEGMNDARSLACFPDLPNAVVARWVFLQGVGQENAGLADLRRLTVTTKDVNAGYYYCIALYLRGKFEDAARVLKERKGLTVVDLLQVLPLAELPDGPKRAYQLYEEIAARDLRSWDLFNSQLILRFLGQKEKAIAESQKFLAQPDRFPPVRQDSFRRQLEYCAGQRSEEDLVSSMKDSREHLSGAHVCIALTALADGNRDKARKHLQLCYETRFFDIFPYDLSLMLLSRMKDPNWPPWIPVKKGAVEQGGCPASLEAICRKCLQFYSRDCYADAKRSG
jgi:serine/threonine protein kinase